MKYKCPVCGYRGLRDKPYNKDGYGSEEICVCCGFHFGCDDYPDKEKSFIEWREKWTGNGYKWFSKRTSPPEGWNPKENVPDKILKGEDALEITTQILKVNSDSKTN